MKKYFVLVTFFGVAHLCGMDSVACSKYAAAQVDVCAANKFLEAHIQDHESVIRALINGADKDARSSMGYHMINHAIYFRSLPSVIALLYSGADIWASDFSPLVTMVNGVLCHRTFCPLDWARWVKNCGEPSRVIWHLIRTYRHPRDLSRTPRDYMLLHVPEKDAELLVQTTRKVVADFERMKRESMEDVFVSASGGCVGDFFPARAEKILANEL